MLPVLIVVVYALAVARLTRLVIEDRILQAPRTKLASRLWYWSVPWSDVHARRASDPLMAVDSPTVVRWRLARERVAVGAEKPLTVYMLTCPWCVSIYIGAVAAPLAYFWGALPWLFVPALALAFSYFTGFAAGRE